MPEYTIETDTGLSLTLEADGELTEEDVRAFLKNRQKEAVLKLQEGPGFTGERTERGRRIKRKAKDFYPEYIAQALNIPEEKFNYSKGLPIGMRAKMDFLQNLSSQAALLRQEYGEDNVASLNIGGKPSLLYRDPKADEWRLADSLEFELADFTADIAGDIAPTGAGILAGLGAFTATLPSAPATAGTSTVAATAAAAAGAEAAVGTAQDIAARQMMGIDMELGEIVSRRSKELALNFTIEVVTMKTGSLLKGLIGKQGTDVATKEVLEVGDILNRRIPTYMQQGDEGIRRAQDIAEKFPNSAPARFFADIRDAAGQRIINEFGVEELSEEAAERVLRDGLETMTAQASDDIAKINARLDDLAASKEKLKGIKEGQITAQAKKEAKDAFNAELQRKAKNVTTKGEVSPEKTGLNFQRRMAQQYVETEAQSKRLWNDAYFKLQNVRASANELQNVFGKTKNQAILDNEDEVIAVLAPGGRTASGRAVNSLDDIAEESISFQQINELIQLISDKARYGAATPGFNAASYRKLADDLRKKRSALLRRADPGARTAFNLANDNFRKNVLPFRESDIFKSISPELGQNYNKAINDAVAGREFVLPKLGVGGTEVINTALRNPKNIKDFLRSAGNTLEARKLLRDAWLSSKGLVGGQPIPKSALKFTPADIDIASTLWPGAGAAGFNRKAQTLRSLAKFADEADDYIDGVTVETFNRLINEGFGEAQTEIAKIAAEEVAQKKALNDLTKDKLVKLMGEGRVPLPTNSITLESFAEGILKSSPKDVQKFMDKMAKDAPETVDAFRRAVYQSLVRKAGRGTDAAQQDKLGFQLWKPDSMANQIKANENNLAIILGKDAVKNIEVLNNGIQRFSVRKDIDPEGRLSGASSGRGVSIFFSNIGGAVKDRYAKYLLSAQVLSPIPFKRIETAEQYNKFMNAWLKGLFIGSTTARNMIDEADADPEFRKSLTEVYSELFTEPTE
jgi:hypothetical protein